MIALLSLVIWLYLVFLHGRFWSSSPELRPETGAATAALPDIDVIVPARDEVATIGPVIASLLAQDYAGNFRVILVDDNSTDGTAAAAGTAPRLQILHGQPKPAGWSGKLWALSQGVAASSAPVLLFTDADIVHDPRHLSTLVARLDAPRVELVSEMVRLNCTSLAERALVPAFVYFFQMLYPFASVNNPRAKVAGAAGGTVLVRSDSLAGIGGIEAIKSALIDDCTLAKAIKGVGPIYLGHSGLARSVRPYPHFADIWNMIARTAFTQLRYSAPLLLLTLVGLTIVWLVPVGALVFGTGWIRASGAAACVLAAASYVPTLLRYERSPLWAAALPLIALFYMAATVGSAVKHWFGRGSQWKNRAYG
ncbi:MAG: glycosyltransferase [Proteobacteria bacterium]|nr:glycosyltransferase [Pseudomonadota bacterium]